MQINTSTSGNQGLGETIALDDGRFFVVWQDNAFGDGDNGNVLRGQFLNADGTLNGGEILLTTNTVEGSDGMDAETIDVTQGADGTIVVSYLQDDASAATNGQPTGTVQVIAIDPSDSSFIEFNLTDTTGSFGDSPARVEALNDGNFIAVWTERGEGDNTADKDMFAQVFQSDGTLNGAVLLDAISVEGFDGFHLDHFDVDVGADGNVLVSWQTPDVGPDNTGSTEALQVLIEFPGGDTTLPPTINDLGLLNAGPTINYASPPMTLSLSNGQYLTLVSNQGFSSTNPDGLYAQIRDADGTPDGTEFEISGSTLGPENQDGYDVPNFTMLEAMDGTVLVSYADTTGDVVGVLIDVAAGTSGTPFAISSNTGNESPPVMTVSGNTFYLAWYENGANAATGDVYWAAVGSDGTISQPATLHSTINVEGLDAIDNTVLDIDVSTSGTVLISYTADDFEAFDGDGSAIFASIICFASGTEIQALNGLKPVEKLQIGDLIPTKDAGVQAIRWIGRRKYNSEQLRANSKLQPVRITAGALGQGLPKKDLIVSRQHRILVSSQITKRMFNEDEVLIAAINLTELPGIFVDEQCEEVEYFHLLFDRHEVIYAEGASSESLFVGPEALQTVSPEAREEILSIFPELDDLDYAPVPARVIPNGNMQKKLIARHLKNQKPCLPVTFRAADSTCQRKV